jgi:hypothetical protein
MVLALVAWVIVDLESGRFMDETMHLFDVYKTKHIVEIERKHKEINVKVRGPPVQVAVVLGGGDGRMLLIRRLPGRRGI